MKNSFLVERVKCRFSIIKAFLITSGILLTLTACLANQPVFADSLTGSVDVADDCRATAAQGVYVVPNGSDTNITLYNASYTNEITATSPAGSFTFERNNKVSTSNSNSHTFNFGPITSGVQITLTPIPSNYSDPTVTNNCPMNQTPKVGYINIIIAAPVRTPVSAPVTQPTTSATTAQNKTSTSATTTTETTPAPATATPVATTTATPVTANKPVVVATNNPQPTKIGLVNSANASTTFGILLFLGLLIYLYGQPLKQRLSMVRAKKR